MTVKRIWHKIKAIPLIGVPYQWLIGKRKAEYEVKKQKQAFDDNGLRYINTINQILQKTNAIFYVYAGTLLGIVRDGALIKWDLDVDYAVVINDSFGWEHLEKTMHASGYKKVREFVLDGEIREQAYQVGKMKIDFFGQFYDGDCMVQYSYERIPEIRYPDSDAFSVYKVTLPKVTKTKYINVDEVKVPVPENAEDILASIYNDDWRVPNPNWKSNSGKASQLIEGKFGYRVV